VSGSQTYPVLLGVCAALVVLIAYQIWAPLPSPTVPHRRAAPVILSTSAIALLNQPPERFAVVSDRPLFDPQRKKFVAPTDAQSQPGAPPPLPTIALIGVIIDHEKSVAIVKAADAAFATSMAVGESVGRWRLSSIQPDRVVLTAGGNSDEIRLDANKPTPVAARQDVSASQASIPKDSTKSTAGSP
jgi:hypothetical protein